MKTLYIECNMGAAGDMLAAALLELHPDPEDFLRRLNAAGIPDVTVSRDTVVRCGISGTHMAVSVGGVHEEELAHHYLHIHEHEHPHTHEHEHPHMHSHEAHTAHTHRSMTDIEHLVRSLAVNDKVRADIIEVYTLIALAESRAHGKPVPDIHFHEVGTMDAVADITAVCMLIDELRPERILASPVHVGSGQVRCAHGVLSVPAPATAWILRGVPIYGGAVQGELCTPTGAALLKHFVSDFGPMPVMCTERIGYGMGTKEFETANCLRALFGESGVQNIDADGMEQIAQLSCNIDDMTGEEIGFAQEQLFAAGALDVYTVPVGMKKNRPGVLLSCICKMEQRTAVMKALFKYTSTLGVREEICRRYVLERTEQTASAGDDTVRIKEAHGYGVQRRKIEYEDAARLARERQSSLRDIISDVFPR